MNHIFKIIWNKSTGRTEVVSELAKGVVKASSTATSTSTSTSASTFGTNQTKKVTKGLSLSVLTAATALATGFVHAEEYLNVNQNGSNTSQTDNNWLVSNTSKTEGEKRSVRFKTNLDKSTSGATGKRAIAVGVYANALGTDSIAVGSRANVNNFWGSQSRDSKNSIAIGRQAQVENAENAIAFGANSNILHNLTFNSRPNNAIAIGNNSKIVGASNSIAIGNKADISAIDGSRGSAANNAIAIGNQATVRRTNSISLGYDADTAGSDSVTIGVSTRTAKSSSITIGYKAETKQDRGIAIGTLAKAQGDRSLAIGSEAVSEGSRSIVIGGLSTDRTNNVAKSESGTTQAIVIGNGAQAKTGANDSVTLGSRAQTAASNGISIGNSSKVNVQAIGGIALGRSAVASNKGDIAIGQNSTTSTPNNLSTLTIGDQVLEKGVVTTPNVGVVSVGNVNVKRQIQNVAAGNVSENSTDAITGSQLYRVIKAVDEIAKTEYVFTVNDQTAKTMQNKGTNNQNTTNNKLDFKAGEGLTVAYKSDAITYELNEESKQAIEDAKGAAGTVNAKLTEINEAASRAEQAATKAETAKDNAEQAATKAETAKDNAEQAAT
ncbi:ESPR-type extended signal peptide-containing protein, partial [Haemophilus influenzae]|uniref:ESPR-type extended signal peptide-containing protein n=1 Tax=Haemophilus influenzae TaxID=727 RepID=UPI0021591554